MLYLLLGVFILSNLMCSPDLTRCAVLKSLVFILFFLLLLLIFLRMNS